MIVKAGHPNLSTLPSGAHILMSESLCHISDLAEYQLFGAAESLKCDVDEGANK